MSIGLFGRKIGMTQIFADDGTAVSVTLVQAETCQVSQIKTVDMDSYNAIQVSFVEQSLNKITMLTMSYICISLSLFSLLLVIRIIRKKEKKRVLRYYGITKKKYL